MDGSQSLDSDLQSRGKNFSTGRTDQISPQNEDRKTNKTQNQGEVEDIWGYTGKVLTCTP